MKTKSDTVKNVCKVVMLPVFVYLLFFIGKPASLIMNLKQTLAPTLISFAMCSNMLCNRMDLSAGAVVMLSAMFGAKMVYLYGIGLIPFALIVVGAGIVLGTISGVMYMLLRVPAIVTALGVCMVYETLSNLASISWVTAINGEITTLGRFPYCLIIFAIMFVLFYIIFNYTKFGYNVRACASSQRIAKNSGVNTKKTAFLCYVVSSLFLGVAALLKISIQGSIDTPMYMSSTNIIFNCMLGIYVGLALEQYCNLVIGIFIGNFILNMLTTGLLSMGLSASLQDTASGIFLLVIMIFTYNNQRVMNFISEQKLKKELAEANDKYLRLMAEYDNFRKRSAKERLELTDTAKGNVINGFLPVFDNFERALGTETQDAVYKQGVEMIFNQFSDALKKLNVEVMELAGKEFDPNVATAVSTVDDPDLGENIVAQVLQNGYTIGGKVIRHAMVIVANP